MIPFLDVARLTRYEFYNKLKYKSDGEWGLEQQVGYPFSLMKKRIGGQTDFNSSSDEGTMEVYGQTMNYNQPELWSKTAYRFNDSQRVVLFASGNFSNPGFMVWAGEL